jgi:hypothetical protein
MRHLLLFLGLTDWHALVSADELTLSGILHITVHSQVVVRRLSLIVVANVVVEH